MRPAPRRLLRQAAWGWVLVAVLVGPLPIAVGAGAEHRAELEVRAGEELTVDLEPGGTVDVTTWDEPRLQVDARFHGRDAETIEFVVERTSGGARIVARFADRHRDHGSGGRVQIRLPRKFDLDVRTSGGDIRIRGLTGRITGQTQGGELELAELGGTVELTTLGGNVELSRSRVDGKLETHGGNVHLSDVDGNLEADTLGGNVIYQDVRPSGSPRAAGQEIKITTQGGDIRVPAAPFGADLETMGGNIDVESAGDYVKAKTLGGHVRIAAVEGWVKATTLGGTIRVRLVESPGHDRRDVWLSSNGGDIELTLPRGFSADFDVTVAYTRNSDQDYEIRSDFPIGVQRAGNWDYASGTPYKYIHGSGGGGRHRVKIETVNGDVVISREDR